MRGADQQGTTLRVELEPAGDRRVEGPGGSTGLGPVQYAPTADFFEPGGGRFEALARTGGSALTLGLVRAASERGRVALAFAVGSATRQVLPSSGRVHVGGVSPLTGSYTEGALGGELAWALGGFADGLVLERAPRAEVGPGGTGGPGGAAVLVVDGRGGAQQRPLVRLESLEDLLGEPPDGALGLGRALDLHLRRALAVGPGESLGVVLGGPAARAGVPYATLVSGGEPPLVTGRGGLGKLLADVGLVALAVVGPTPAAAPAAGERLPVSPRLAERARAGTFELFGAFAARGELAGRNYAAFLSVDEGRALTAEAARGRVAQHGCKGCPTPCGLVFERGTGQAPAGTTPAKGEGRGGARFSATWALGPNLGFAVEAGAGQPSAFRAALDLLAACDDRGLDAREAGACLALLARAAELGRPAALERGGAARFGQLDALRAALGQLPPVGSAALAAELGLEHEHFAAQGQAARPEGNLASVLGQVVSTGGNDPLRSFPFTVARGRFDPREPAGKGALVAWHEDLAAALDLVGFCGFSAAGLLVDGVLDLDGLARWVLPSASSGVGLLEAGRALVLARRAFDEELGAHAGLTAEELPAWARADLLAPGMLDEYRRARGLDAAGRLLPEARAWLAGSLEPGPWGELSSALPEAGGSGQGMAAEAPDATGEPAPSRQGRVQLRATGRLGDLLGELDLELELPARLAEVLAAAARARPGAAELLLDRAGQPLPAVWRAGRPVYATDAVAAGERLDLLLAIAGG